MILDKKQMTGYNLDQCGYQHVAEEILAPMDRVPFDITAILGGAE